MRYVSICCSIPTVFDLFDVFSECSQSSSYLKHRDSHDGSEVLSSVSVLAKVSWHSALSAHQLAAPWSCRWTCMGQLYTAMTQAYGQILQSKHGCPVLSSCCLGGVLSRRWVDQLEYSKIGLSATVFHHHLPMCDFRYGYKDLRWGSRCAVMICHDVLHWCSVSEVSARLLPARQVWKPENSTTKCIYSGWPDKLNVTNRFQWFKPSEHRKNLRVFKSVYSCLHSNSFKKKAMRCNERSDDDSKSRARYNIA